MSEEVPKSRPISNAKIDPPCISAAPAALDRYRRGFAGLVVRPTRSIRRDFGVASNYTTTHQISHPSYPPSPQLRLAREKPRRRNNGQKPICDLLLAWRERIESLCAEVLVDQ